MKQKRPVNISKIGTVANPATDQDIKKTKESVPDMTMKIGVLTDGIDVIVVKLDKNDNPIDNDGTLFGPTSGRNIEDFDMQHFNPISGEVIIVEGRTYLRID